jgi:hypothetical protein
MSCDGNRHKFFAHAAHDARDAFGGTAEAQEALEQVFQTARSQQGKTGMSQLEAEARTRKLFDEMRGLGIKPPTHSRNGLPRPDAQFGYAEVQRTLSAVRSGETLPDIARLVRHKKLASKVNKQVAETAVSAVTIGVASAVAGPGAGVAVGALKAAHEIARRAQARKQRKQEDEEHRRFLEENKKE